jgi:hypothetical protein
MSSPEQFRDLPGAFGRVIADGVETMLKNQQPDGSIIYDPKAPIVYPQQSIMPLAYCWAGLDGTGRYKASKDVLTAIRKLGDFLVSRFNDSGEFEWDSYGNKVKGVDQRLTYAWTEGLRILRENNADLDYARWQDRIVRACDQLISHRLKKLEGVRRFIGRVMGTSTNHVALYVTTLYRASEVFKRGDYRDFILPMARALAEDVHPDGYWEEHGDLLRTGGPTLSYNYLTHCGSSLMYEWTKEPVFLNAIARSTAFHGNFSYPDGTFCEVLDERVRQDLRPRQWGLFGLSHWPEGRGMAAVKFSNWAAMESKKMSAYPETLARHCENQMYWHNGPIAPARFERRDNAARLVLPGGLFRRGAWCVGLSALSATNAEDPAYRENPFALDRQKLISIWHERAGLILDGSQSKKQPENSTFAAKGQYADDYWPCGGNVGESGNSLFVHAAYKTFYGNVRINIIDDSSIELDYSVDPAGCQGPFTVAFTMMLQKQKEITAGGKRLALGSDSFEQPLRGSDNTVKLGAITVTACQDSNVNWPMMPFNSYAADNKGSLESALLRVSTVLTRQSPRARFLIKVG